MAIKEYPSAGAIPSIAGQSGKFLTTNGSFLSWSPNTIKAVYTTTRTSSFSTSSGSLTDVTGLSVTLTPQFSSSRFLVLLSTQFNPKSATYVTGQVVRNGSAIASWQIGDSGNPAQYKSTWATTYVDSPATTNSLTYKYQVRCDNGGTIELEGVASLIILEI